MSRLFFTDRGRMLRTHNEEITAWRWARKRLDVPPSAVGSPADLWLYLRAYRAQGGAPLEVRVNRRPTAKLLPLAGVPADWYWYRVPVARVPAKRVEVELRAATPVMNAWMLGLDPSVLPAPPECSDLSLDQGKSWQHESMGAHQALRGEYMVRLRSHAPTLGDLPVPKIQYEDPRHPHVRELLDVLPAAIKNQRDPWRQVLALRTWICSRWTHDPFGQAYAPWEAATILDWARRGEGHGQHGKVAFCVHFAIVMVNLASALGHRARGVVVTHDVNGPAGHFLAEVFDEASGRWCLHDPNYDVHYHDGHPLSARELADRALAEEDLRHAVVRGPAYPRGPQRLLKAFRQNFGPGRSYRNIGILRYNNLISDPTVGPPNHGAVAYCETDFIWYNPAPHDLVPMFPYRTGEAKVFDQA